MVRHQKIYAKIISLIVLSGCATTPDYQPSTARFNPEQDPIAAMLHMNQDQFRKCYEYSMEMRQGIVRLAFVISSSGEVGEVKIAGTTLNNPDVEACCIAVVKKIRFQENSDEGEGKPYEYPIEFGTD